MRALTSTTITLANGVSPILVGGDRRALAYTDLLGIERQDAQAVKNYRVQNYQFFGAPVALFFTIDRDMEQGSWVDYGMFLQSFMLAAREMGMETCAQAAFCPYHDSVMPILEAPR